MRTKLPYIITALLLCFAGSAAFGQQGKTHSGSTTYTPSNDNYGSVQVDYKYAFNGTQFKIKIAQVVVEFSVAMAQNEPELHNELRKRGILPHTQQDGAGVGFDYEGLVDLLGYNNNLQRIASSVHVTGTDYTFFEPDELAKKHAQEYYEKYKSNYYSDQASLASFTITSFQFSDLDRKIEAVRREIAEGKKAEKEKAEKEKQEAEQKEKQEKAEQEKKEAEAKKTASAGSGSSSGSSNKKEDKSDDKDGDKEETGSDKKSSKTTYIPKSNRQLYNELKAMTDAHPEMLNDPKIRTRLRGYKAFADRDDRNIRDYNTLEQTMGGGYNPNKIAAMNSIYQTNSNIAQAEMGVGAVVDEATNVVNSIIDEQNRKQDERNEEFRQQKSNALEKKQAIIEWERKIGEKRSDFEYEVAKKIKENFKLIATIPDMPVTYETEKYIEGGSYYKGNKSYYNAPSFEKITKELKDGGEAKTYNIYIAELDGLYGILGDDGEALYPPQFEGIYALNLKNENKRPRFLVNIKDKWGELLADGTIAEAIKYDGIWYSPDKKSKILKQGDNWQIKSLEENRLLKQFSSDQIINLYAGGLIPISNTNQKQFNQFIGTYSLAGDGKVYVWGEAKEKGVVPILYDLAKKGEVTERLFKINNRWFITSGFGTKEMKIEPMPSTFVIPVIREKKWGAIDESGKTVIPFEHSYVRNSGNEFETDKGVYKTDGTLVTGGETKAALKNAAKKYYDNGNLKSIGTYDANGNMTGTWKSYYETGQIHIEAEYLNGKYNGKWTSHFNNGKLSSIGNYKNGKKTGEWKFYNENGQVAMEGVFVDGNYNGEWKFYYKSGKLQKKGALTGSDANGKAQGEWYSYYENGNVESISTAKDNIPDGQWKSYYENGKLKETGTYKAGEKVGKWHYYDKNGNEI